MYKAFRVLAIVVLLVTIAGAGVVLYGINTLAPQVTQAAVTATPAVQAQEIFDGLMDQVRAQTFTGSIFGDAAGLDAKDCTFMTYTVRLANKGFFPVEWLGLRILPGGEGADVLQLDNNGANVLAAGSEGDLSATILTTGSADQTQRAFEVVCYVLGQKTILTGSAQ